MSDNTPTSKMTTREHLHAISELLRHVNHLDHDAQVLLADLVEELSKSLEASDVPSAELARLTESASHMVAAVRDKKEPGVLETARNRLDRAVIAVETDAPVLAGLTRRFAEMLANLGI